MNKQNVIGEIETFQTVDFQNANVVSMEDVKAVIEQMFDDFDNELSSDANGYLSGLAEYGRFKKNTKYRVYIEEVT